MALIKKSEFKQMDEKRLKDKIVELRKEMMKVNAQIKMGTTLENPGRPKIIKKTIAKVYTLLTEKKNNKKVAREIQPNQNKKVIGGKS